MRAYPNTGFLSIKKPRDNGVRWALTWAYHASANALVACLVGATLHKPAHQGDDLAAIDPAKVAVLYDRRFRLLGPDGQRRLGMLETEAVLNEGDKRIEIVESMSMDLRGRKVGCTSTVIYTTETGVTPISGTAETMRSTARPARRAL